MQLNAKKDIAADVRKFELILKVPLKALQQCFHTLVVIISWFLNEIKLKSEPCSRTNWGVTNSLRRDLSGFEFPSFYLMESK